MVTQIDAPTPMLASNTTSGSPRLATTVRTNRSSRSCIRFLRKPRTRIQQGFPPRYPYTRSFGRAGAHKASSNRARSPRRAGDFPRWSASFEDLLEVLDELVIALGGHAEHPLRHATHEASCVEVYVPREPHPALDRLDRADVGRNHLPHVAALEDDHVRDLVGDDLLGAGDPGLDVEDGALTELAVSFDHGRRVDVLVPVRIVAHVRDVCEDVLRRPGDECAAFPADHIAVLQIQCCIKRLSFG